MQIYERGARILEGYYMTQDLSFGASNSESGSGSESATVLSVSIVDPYVLLRMSDGGIRLLVGGICSQVLCNLTHDSACSHCHSYCGFSCWFCYLLEHRFELSVLLIALILKCSNKKMEPKVNILLLKSSLYNLKGQNFACICMSDNHQNSVLWNYTFICMLGTVSENSILFPVLIL